MQIFVIFLSPSLEAMGKKKKTKEFSYTAGQLSL